MASILTGAATLFAMTAMVVISNVLNIGLVIMAVAAVWGVYLFLTRPGARQTAVQPVSPIAPDEASTDVYTDLSDTYPIPASTVTLPGQRESRPVRETVGAGR